MDPPEKSHVGEVDVEAGVHVGANGELLSTDANGTVVPYCGSCYGAGSEPGACCNTCASVRDAYRLRGWALSSAGTVAQCAREGFAETMSLQAGEGCQIYGHFEVNKVAGNFHFAPGKSFQQGAVHVHDLMVFGDNAYFNMSHVINKLSYGADFPGLLNPLDGAAAAQTGGHLMYQYFIKVVPTLYVDRKGGVLRTAQFSVTENAKCGRGSCLLTCRRMRADARAPCIRIRGVDAFSGRTLPGVFFFYDINPIQVRASLLRQDTTNRAHVCGACSYRAASPCRSGFRRPSRASRTS